jgi:hypothetical protein
MTKKSSRKMSTFPLRNRYRQRIDDRKLMTENCRPVRCVVDEEATGENLDGEKQAERG